MTLRCEECGYKLYDDEDECPKCGASVDDRPRSKKKSRDEYDDEDDRPKKKKPAADFEVLDDEDEPPAKKPAPTKKPPSADFDIEVEEEEQPKKAPPPSKKGPPPPPKPPTPPAAKKPAAKSGGLFDDDEPAPTPKKVAKPAPRDVDDDEEDRPKKKPSKGQYDDLVVKRWTGVFTWTLLLGIFGPILLGAGLWMVESSGIGIIRRMEPGLLGAPREVIEYRERDDLKMNLGTGLAIVGGSAWVMAGLLFYLWLWRAWKLVPKEYGGLNPFVALLLLWVPLLNLVGIFLVLPGLSKAYRRMLEDLEPNRFAKTGVGVGMCACIFLFIPALNVIAPLMLLAWFDQANFAKNRIEAIQEAARV